MSIIFRRPRLLQTCKNCINSYRPLFGKVGGDSGFKYFKVLLGLGAAAGTAIASYKILRVKSETQWEKSLDLRHKFNFINKVVEKCAPGVVYVEIKEPKLIDKVTRLASIVSNGSGFIIGDDGWILTNAHVVINKPNAVIEVKLHDGSSYVATVEDVDMNIDLALIKIEPERKLQSLQLAKSGDVSVGEWVVALGSPLSLTHSATAGVVSSVNRNASELGLRNYQMKYIQTDAPITFGNSGGPLVNLDGDVIGINNLRITAGISFAIPIDYVSKFLNHTQFNKNYKRNVNSDNELGMTTLSVNSDLLKEIPSAYAVQSELTHGILVWKIKQGGLAERGGLKVGDIITHIDGKPVQNAADIYFYVADTQKTYNMKIIRNGENIMLPLTWK